MSLAWWNGRTVPAGEVQIPADDSGFLFGDGLFETLRVDEGRARDVEAHLDRLLAGLRRVEIDLPEDRKALEQAVAEIAGAAPWPVARLRITITHSTRLITTARYEPPEIVTARLLPQYRIHSGHPLAGLKSLSYQSHRLALREAESRGAWEVLLLNEQDRLVEGARSNLALVFENRILTPPTTDGCLPGTVRRRLLERGPRRGAPHGGGPGDGARGADDEQPDRRNTRVADRRAGDARRIHGRAAATDLDGEVGSTSPAPSAAPLPPPA